jgi:hypothetical protein
MSTLDFVTAHITSKLMDGKSFSITTDNPDTISRMRTLAQDLGAPITEFRERDGLTQIVIAPPTTQ